MTDQQLMHVTTTVSPFLLWAQWATVNHWRQHGSYPDVALIGASIGRALNCAGHELKEIGYAYASPVVSFHDKLRRLGLLPK
jgi:hypothetical protein